MAGSTTITNISAGSVEVGGIDIAKGGDLTVENWGVLSQTPKVKALLSSKSIRVGGVSKDKPATKTARKAD